MTIEQICNDTFDICILLICVVVLPMMMIALHKSGDDKCQERNEQTKKKLLRELLTQGMVIRKSNSPHLTSVEGVMDLGGERSFPEKEEDPA